jgi:3-methyladenine DNA glycosylase AlkC
MAELLKYIYNNAFFETYSSALSEVIPAFDKTAFMAAFAAPHWESLELKQRMAYLAHITDKWLPESNQEKVDTIIRLIEVLQKLGVKDQNLEYIFLPDIIIEHGMNDLKTTVDAIEKVTQFVSCEFAGRALIMKYPKEMMRQMLRWTSHKNENVRRYASEGCRPRLPWGTKLMALVHNPAPCFPVLEKLMDDPSVYVRKSVANHLNDISKDHPDLVVDFIKKWKGHTETSDWILRHGARTLLKSGHPEVLHIFGTSGHFPYKLEKFIVENTIVTPDDHLSFSFMLTNLDEKEAVFRVEYNIWYVKAGGHYSKKIFKIAEKPIAVLSGQTFKKVHRFQDLTTRKHHPGTHKISLVINGNESDALSFEVKI